MTSFEVFSYMLTVFAITVAPGPVVLLIIARAASRDMRGALGVATGYTAGRLLALTGLCFGLSAYVTASPELIQYGKYAMILYILILARRIWNGRLDIDAPVTPRPAGLVGAVCTGLFTCLVSPYTLILIPLFLPKMMDGALIQMPQFLLIVTTTLFAMVLGLALIIGGAAQLRKLARSPSATQRLNRGLSCVMVTSGSWMVLG